MQLGVEESSLSETSVNISPRLFVNIPEPHEQVRAEWMPANKVQSFQLFQVAIVQGGQVLGRAGRNI